MPSQNRLDLIIHCPGSHGIVADQIHRQACAFHELGLSILVLCSPNFVRTRAADYPVLPCLMEGATAGTSNIFSRRVAKSFQIAFNQLRFGWEVLRRKPVIVLSGSHVTSQSALWIWLHVLASLLLKTVYTTNLHFSTRDHNLGPKWWQKLNTALSFRPFRIGIAHKRFPRPSPIPNFLQSVEVPLGPERHANIRENPKAIRKRWRVARGKKVFLAFGPVRNHKNLDLAIRALVDNPKAHLVVLGSVPTHKDRPMKYYEMLAEDLGVSKRLFISEDFVPDEKRLCHFQAADFVLLTYSSAYHSQSSTLATAVAARRPVLGASGDSPMRDMVRHFGLGVYVDPDSSEAVADAMATLIHGESPRANWLGFEEFATWETNATRILQAVLNYVQDRPLPGRLFEGREDESAPDLKLLKAQDFAPAKKSAPAKKVRTQKAKKSVPRVGPAPVVSDFSKQTPRRGRPPKSAQAPPPFAETPPTKRGRKPKLGKTKTSTVSALPATPPPANALPSPHSSPPPAKPSNALEVSDKPQQSTAEPANSGPNSIKFRQTAVAKFSKRITLPGTVSKVETAPEPTVAEPEPAAPPPALASEPAPIAPPAAPVAPPAPATPAEPAPQPSGGLLSRAFDSSRFRTTRPLPVFVSTSSIFASPSKPAAAEPAQNGHSNGTNGNNAPAEPRPRRGRKKALAA
jgi:glycosyltransferase involved in cell wall biosynthesis